MITRDTTSSARERAKWTKLWTKRRLDATAKAKTVNIHEAKTHFSRQIKRVERGDEIVIARAGHPVARLCAVAPTGGAPRAPGTGKGLFATTDDFDAPLPPELQWLFE